MIKLREVGAWRGIRSLYWDGDILYGCRGYELIRLQTAQAHSMQSVQWEPVASFRPEWWRGLTVRNRLTYRLVRDGFHALALPNNHDIGSIIAAVPGAIVTRSPGDTHFHVTHKIIRGTRPLHIAAVPNGNIYWGEYFDNRDRSEVHIYASLDGGRTWEVAHTFPAGDIRHVHNIVYDQWNDCLWILTGDEGSECKVIRAASDLRSFDTVLSGHQRARAVAAIPAADALYLSTDTPIERNHVLRVDRTGRIEKLANLESSSIFGCQTLDGMFFSTMAEPSSVNSSRTVTLVGCGDGRDWQVLAHWQKDSLPMHYFQYGNAILPDGQNTTRLLAATTVAVENDDLMTFLWETEGLAP